MKHHNQSPSLKEPLAGEWRILIIDDSEADRYVFKRVLKRPGLSMSEAETGTQGLEIARTWKPDFIFLDLNIPDMSGFEILELLAAEPETAAIPIIIHSSQTLTESEKVFLEGRAKAVLSKDSDHKEEFRTFVSSLLAHPPTSHRKGG
jgi:CheY-like chemotaxis protein